MNRHRVAALAASFVAAFALGTDARGDDPIVVAAGADLVEVTGTVYVEIPAGFLASGSAAFAGNVAMTGVRLETAGPYELGTTSAILRHATDVELPDSSSTPVHAVTQWTELKLIGDAPIDVVVGSTTQQWAVSAILSERTEAYGQYDLVRTGSDGGTFAGSVVTPLTLVFRRNASPTKRLDLGSITLSTSQGTWSTIDASSVAGLAVARLPLAIAISATLTASTVQLTVGPAAANAQHPGPSYVDPTAYVDRAVGSLGRGCSIGAGASIASGAVIGPHATIGNNAQIGTGAVICDGASIGSDVVIGSSAFVDSDAVIAAGATIGANAVVGNSSNLGINVQVGAGARIGGQCVLGDASAVGAGCDLGRDVHMGAGSSTIAGIQIAPRAVIPASTTQSTSLVACVQLDGTTVIKALPPSSWSSSDPHSSIHQASGYKSVSTSIAEPPTLTELLPVDKDNPPPKYPPSPDLADDIGTDVARPELGGTGEEYLEGSFECG